MPDDAQPPRRRRWLQAVVVLGIFAVASAFGIMYAGAKPDDTDFSQCANDNPTSGDCEWVNGILQGNNSAYFEGTSTLQRLVFKGIDPVPGDTHTVTFTADATKGGVHAYDWLTSWDQALQTLAEAGAPINNLNPCGDLGGLEALCEELHDTPNTVTVAVPQDPFISASPDDGGPLSTTQTLIDAYETMYGDRTIRLYAADGSPITGATLTLSHSVPSQGDTGDSEILYTLTYTSNTPDLLVEFAAHLAVGGAATGEAWGAGFGASSVSGGPYHVQLKQFDGDALGSMDNQLQGAAVQPRPASITITKVTDPEENSQDFAFGVAGAGLADFNLDGDADDDATPNTRTFMILGSQIAGPYTITESPLPSGWTLSNLVCVDSTPLGTSVTGATATLSVAPGDVISCTYTNAQDATVTVTKVTDPGDAERNFAFTTTGDGVTNFALDTDAGDATLAATETFTISGDDLGAVTIRETGAPGWTLTDLTCTGDPEFTEDGATANLDVDAGETIVCTYTNTEDGSVTVRKVTDPASSPQDFAFTTTGDGVADFALDTDANAALAATETFTISGNDLGAVTITETAVDGWTLTDLSCQGDADFAEDGATATLDVDAGETIECTYTNTQDATVTVTKITDPGDAEQDFAFTTTGNGLSDFSLDTDDGDAALADSETFTISGDELGAVTISETDVIGWTLTGLTCQGDADFSEEGATATLDVDAGESIECTYTNTQAELEVSECPEEEEGLRGSFSRGGDDCADEEEEEKGDDEGDDEPVEVAGDPVEVAGNNVTNNNPLLISPQIEVQDPAPAPAPDPAVSPALEVAPITLQQLPRTGSSVNLMKQAMLALLLVVIGLPAMIFGRRRRTAQA